MVRRLGWTDGLEWADHGAEKLLEMSRLKILRDNWVRVLGLGQ